MPTTQKMSEYLADMLVGEWGKEKTLAKLDQIMAEAKEQKASGSVKNSLRRIREYVEKKGRS